jgi:hypothetical protein
MMETINDVMDRLERAQSESELFDGDAHGYLTAVYQGKIKGDYTRMKAASIAIEYERPTLKATAIIQGGDIAERLERAIERSQNGGKLPPKVIEARPATEHSASELTPQASARSFIRPRRRISKI